MTGITLDAGALIALDRNDRRVIALISRTHDHGGRVTIPATVLAQALRNPAKQVRIQRISRHPATDVVPMDRLDAAAVGLLLAQAGSSDIVDAHVAVCARRTKSTIIITSDPEDLRKLAPQVPVFAI